MTIYPRTAPKRHNSLACLLVGVVVAASSGTAATAAPAANTAGEQVIATLRHRGFTRADFDDFKVTQVTPHYERYIRWQRCAAGAVDFALVHTERLSDARSLGALTCNDSASLVRASIAREIGLERATRVKKLLDAMIDEGVVQRWRAAHAEDLEPASHPLKDTVRIGHWTIRPIGGGCQAEMDPTDAGEFKVALLQNRFTIQLVLRSAQTRLPAMPYTAPRIIAMPTGTGVYTMTRDFTVAASRGSAWMYAVLDKPDLVAMRRARGLVLRGARDPAGTAIASGDEPFLMDPIEPIIDTLRRC